MWPDWDVVSDIAPSDVDIRLRVVYLGNEIRDTRYEIPFVLLIYLRARGR